jgi:hypothetical protein
VGAVIAESWHRNRQEQHRPCLHLLHRRSELLPRRIFTAASPPPTGARGEHRSPLLLWCPAFEQRTRLSLVSSLLVCCPLPAHAAAQTCRRLRAGHRAEPVALQVPLPTATCALLALHRVDLVPTSARRVPARRRHPHGCTTVVWHALARTPEGLDPSVLLCNLFTHVLSRV